MAGTKTVVDFNTALILITHNNCTSMLWAARIQLANTRQHITTYTVCVLLYRPCRFYKQQPAINGCAPEWTGFNYVCK